MRTLGIDLSASPKNTAACVIAWEHGGAVVEELSVDLGDDSLLDKMPTAAWTGIDGRLDGIDAPFGWPAEFPEAITQWATQGAWPKRDRDRLRFRETDRFVQRTARLPLSVSSDRIAVTAMRCASLLTALGERPAGAGGAALIRDAVLLEAARSSPSTEKLARNADHMRRELGARGASAPRTQEVLPPHLPGLLARESTRPGHRASRSKPTESEDTPRMFSWGRETLSSHAVLGLHASRPRPAPRLLDWLIRCSLSVEGPRVKHGISRVAG